MIEKNKRYVLTILFLLLTKAVSAGALEDALSEFKFLLYGISAGVAAILLVIQGIRLKLANSSAEREGAKRGMMFVILGLILIIVASIFVELIYRIPQEGDLMDLNITTE